MKIINELCLNCGLCCDGALFDDVELLPADAPGRLLNLGLSLFKKTKQTSAFCQPCACFDGRYCKIYSERPARCRLFECGLLKKVGAGEMRVDAALRQIWEAKLLVAKVRDLLHAFGQWSQGEPLSAGYANAMARPIELSNGAAMERQAELMRVYAQLMAILQNEFLQ